MKHDKLIINGCVYIKETTEALKPRQRSKYWINSNGQIVTFSRDGSPPTVGLFSASPTSTIFNASQIFDGDIVINREDFDLAFASVSIKDYSPLLTFTEALKRELFK